MALAGGGQGHDSRSPSRSRPHRASVEGLKGTAGPPGAGEAGSSRGGSLPSPACPWEAAGRTDPSAPHSSLALVLDPEPEVPWGARSSISTLPRGAEAQGQESQAPDVLEPSPGHPGCWDRALPTPHPALRPPSGKHLEAMERVSPPLPEAGPGAGRAERCPDAAGPAAPQTSHGWGPGLLWSLPRDASRLWGQGTGQRSQRGCRAGHKGQEEAFWKCGTVPSLPFSPTTRGGGSTGHMRQRSEVRAGRRRGT